MAARNAEFEQSVWQTLPIIWDVTVKLDPVQALRRSVGTYLAMLKYTEKIGLLLTILGLLLAEVGCRAIPSQPQNDLAGLDGTPVYVGDGPHIGDTTGRPDGRVADYERNPPINSPLGPSHQGVSATSYQIEKTQTEPELNDVSRQSDAELPPCELSKISLPAYRIEPPDILLIDALRMAPKAPYLIQGLDVLQIIVAGTLPEQPIAGVYQVESDGRITLGPAYGAVNVAGLSISEATSAIEKFLSRNLQAPEVSVSLSQMAGQQQITGEHLVGPDGTVNLGIYGSVYVAGMTIDEAVQAVEEHLSEFLESPQVSIDVFAYNSKVYYIITEGAGFGDTITRLPITGNETVLDAISQTGGLSRLSSKRIWIARPAPSQAGCEQILEVDWRAITMGASTGTNFQILPGDRVFVAEDKLVRLDSTIQKLTAPFERILGFSLLGGQTVQVMNRFPNGRGGGF